VSCPLLDEKEALQAYETATKLYVNQELFYLLFSTTSGI
jgi:hypothetical protein